MIAYIDSSAILRIVLNEPAQIPEQDTIFTRVTSALAEVECLRTIDRLLVMGKHTVAAAGERRQTVYRMLEGFEIVYLSPAVLRRAAQPNPAPLGSFDAIHLATAEVWREMSGQEPIFATHDRQLALAAGANGFRTLGV